jgi:hypothetical protein
MRFLTGNGNYALNDSEGVCVHLDESSPRLRHWLAATVLLFLTCLVLPVLAGFM